MTTAIRAGGGAGGPPGPLRPYAARVVIEGVTAMLMPCFRATRGDNEMTSSNGKADVIAGVSNDAQETIGLSRPYVARVTVEGTTTVLMHRWSCDSVAAKSAAAKGSAAKKSDDVESYVWRDDENRICLPGEYLRQAICSPSGAAKYRQDPRSPRKSALDLYRAAVVSLTDLAPIVTPDGESGHSPCTTWDYVDRRRVTVQRSGITRERPAFYAGWRAEIDLQVLLPEYVAPMDLHGVLTDAGRLVGVGDFRPTFGRFAVVSFDIGVA